jgi:hypothetical protein
MASPGRRFLARPVCFGFSAQMLKFLLIKTAAPAGRRRQNKFAVSGLNIGHPGRLEF